MKNYTGQHARINLDNLFSHHPPKGDQAERYARLRRGFEEARESLLRDTYGNDAFSISPPPAPVRHQKVGTVTRCLADMALECCPPSAEATLAVRQIELARMWANELIITGSGEAPMLVAITEARFWACAAIAINELDD